MAVQSNTLQHQSMDRIEYDVMITSEGTRVHYFKHAVRRMAPRSRRGQHEMEKENYRNRVNLSNCKERWLIYQTDEECRQADASNKCSACVLSAVGP